MSDRSKSHTSRFLESTLNGLSSHIAVVNESGDIVLTNKAYREFAQRNGIDPTKVSEHVNYLTVCDKASGRDSESAHEFGEGLREVLSGKRSSFEMEYPCHSPEKQRWFIVRVTPFEGDGPRLAIVSHENITSRKLTELSLKRTKDELLVTSTMSRVGGWSLDLDSRRLEWSDVTREIHELGPDFIPDVNTAIQFYKEGESRENITIAVARCIEQGKPFEFDTQIITANGRELWVRTMGSAEFENGRCVRIYGTFQDIDERKRAEESLRMHAKRADAMLELPKLTTDYNERVFMQRGMELVEDLTGSSISFIHLIHQGGEEIELVAWSRRTLEHYCKASYDSHYPISKAGIWADALREGKPVIFNDYPSYPHKHGLPEGHSMLQRLISVPVMENGEVVLLAGVGNKETDYTAFDSESVQLVATGIWQIVKEARMARSAREASSRLERLAFHFPGVLYQFQLKPDGTMALPYASMGLRGIYGVSPDEVVDDAAGAFAAIHPDDVADVTKSILESAQTLRVWRSEYRVNSPDGRIIWVEGMAAPEINNDGPVLWHGYVRDFTVQKQLEESETERAKRATAQRNLIAELMFDDTVVNSRLNAALNIVTSRLAEMMHVDRVSVWLLSDDETTFRRVALHDRSGFDSPKDVYHTADIPTYFQALRKDGQVDADDVMNDPRTKELVTGDLLPNRIHSLLDSAIQQDGRLIGVLSVESRGAIRMWQSDEKTFVTTISTLVSQLRTNAERKKAVEELRLLNRAVESSSISVVITDTEGTIRYVNPYFLKTTGYSFDEVVGQNPRVLNSGKQTKEFYLDLWQTILSGKEWTGEFHNVKKNGEHYWESALITPILNAKTGDITHFVAIKEDITEKKKVMEDLVSTMNDKDHLVQELAHRSYNNIQVIMAFIEYTLMMRPELSLEEFAIEVNGQIQSMVLALRQLNKGDQLSKIDLGEYLKALTESVVARRSKAVPIRLRFDLVSIQVLLDSALPVGTVLNELLTNLVNFAFPASMARETPFEVGVSCSLSAMGEIDIRIHDNGIAWATAEGRNELAISTVREQLGGEIHIDTSNGTTIRITYKDNRYSVRV